MKTAGFDIPCRIFVFYRRLGFFCSSHRPGAGRPQTQRPSGRGNLLRCYGGADKGFPRSDNAPYRLRTRESAGFLFFTGGRVSSVTLTGRGREAANATAVRPWELAPVLSAARTRAGHGVGDVLCRPRTRESAGFLFFTGGQVSSVNTRRMASR